MSSKNFGLMATLLLSGICQTAIANDCYDNASNKTVTNKPCRELGLRDGVKLNHENVDMPEMVTQRKLKREADQRLRAANKKLEQEPKK